MFRNRMLGGASFLPLFAPDTPAAGAVDPAEAAEHGDPEFAEAPAGGAAEAPAEGESGEKVEGEEGEAPASAAAKAPGEEDDKVAPADVEQLQKTVRALTKRLGTVTGEKRQLSQKLQESIAAVPKTLPAEAPAGGAAEEQPQRADFATKAEFDTAVNARADQLAAQRVALQDWNNKCNAVEDAGSKAFKDKWATAKANLGVLDDHGQIPTDLLTTALETDNPAQVLFTLGNNLDRAAELMAMTPAKRAIAMDRMAQVKPAERQRSNAPPPIDPINGGGGANDAPSDRDSDAEWHRKEAIREAANRKKRLG